MNIVIKGEYCTAILKAFAFIGCSQRWWNGEDTYADIRESSVCFFVNKDVCWLLVNPRTSNIAIIQNFPMT